MKKVLKKVLLSAPVALAMACAADNTPPEAIARIQEAKVVFTEIMAVEDQAIPQDLLSKAHCVAVIPGVKKAAFLVGGKYGKGVLSCREKSGWSSPATIRLEGGSFGFQAGGIETDLVLLVMNERGADRLMKSEFKIGGEASAAAGPVGRNVSAATDITMRAEMLGYSRARGVFAGVSLEGSTLREDLDDNKVIYGQPYTTQEIVRGKKGRTTTAGREFTSTLAKYSRTEKK